MPDTHWIIETPLPDLSIFRRVTLFCGPDKTAGCDWAGVPLRTGSCHRTTNDNTEYFVDTLTHLYPVTSYIIMHAEQYPVAVAVLGSVSVVYL